MIPTIQRMIDLAQLHRGHPALLRNLPGWHPIEEDPLTPLLLGLGSLGQIARSAPGDLDRLALVGADAYVLIAMLAAGRISPPPTEGDLAALAIEQLERYTANPNGERWRSQPPLEHLMRAFGHWTAVAPVLSVTGSSRVRGLTRVQLADLANYLTFFLTASGALDHFPAAAPAS